jgi:leader peptidase (prepilin peptidase)/N-methyltransferase
MILLQSTLLFVIGWLAGAALNYLADVLPAARSFTAARCHHCQQTIRWLDFLLVRKCRFCSAPRSPRAWIVQVASVAAVFTIWFMPPKVLGPYLAFLVFFYFAAVLIMDVEHRIILHPVSITGAILAVPLGFWLNGWLKTLLGGLAGFGIMLALYYFGELFSRALARARKQPIDETALGFGDVNLSGVLGLMLGWPRITANLFLAILLGGLVSGGYILFMVLRKRYQAFTAIPYAPFLLIAAVVLFYLAG